MRFLAFSLLVFCCHSLASTKCRVYVPEKEFYHYGLSINFDFTSIFDKKNYLEVDSREKAESVLTLRGIEREGTTFHHAVGVLELTKDEGNIITVQESVLCLTQLCSLSDYAKAFRKSYNKFSKSLPSCK